MRVQSLSPVPMAASRAWLSCCLLAWGTLPQGTRAEQRSLRRAGRAAEAMPVISLPMSLLVPDGGEEQRGRAGTLLLQGGHADQKAGDAKGGDAAGLWDVMQEGAKEMIEHARADFFGEATPAPAPAAATTTTALTTQDPAVLARQLQISKDAAQARNILVDMVTKAQLDILSRISDISLDLAATDARAKADMKAINHSAAAASAMPMMASNADMDVKKIGSQSKQIKAQLPVILGRAMNHTKDIEALKREKKQLEADIDAAKKLPGAKRRVENNENTLGALVPRLEKLERKVTKLESRLYNGDLKKLVDDSSDEQVTNVIEDVSRGFGRFLENAG